MKLNRLLILVFFVSCSNKKENLSGFKYLFESRSTKKAILISCIRCNCVIEDLNKLIEEHDTNLAKYTFYGDSNCLKKFKGKARLIHLSQSAIDSISTDFYNILIYNKGRIRMIKTENSDKIPSYLSD